MNQTFYAVGIILVAGLVVFGTLPRTGTVQTDALKKFASYDELKNFIKMNSEDYSAYRSLGGSALMESSSINAPRASVDYSSTNIQVQGVDEADIIKNDGRYIYTISGNNVLIIDAYPAENGKIVSEIDLNGTSLSDIFVNGDRLVVFGSAYDYTFMNIYDISDRTNPLLAQNISTGGYYVSSRMIDNYVYMIVNEPVTRDIPVPALRGVDAFPDIYYFDVPGSSYNYINIVAVDVNNGYAVNKAFLVPYSENIFASKDNIYLAYTKWLDYRDFFDKVVDEVIVPSFPRLAGRITEIRSYKLGRTAQLAEIQETVENYLRTNPEEAASLQKTAEQKMMELQLKISKEMERTVIHKISISGSGIKYESQGSVPGRSLNQFSMDEHDGYFRIATTVDNSFGGSIIGGSIMMNAQSVNNLYVLDSGMNVVGKVEDLAPGERIYSARFAGSRAYMVTFRQIDPLFVIDLTSPTEPKVLGQLKVTGVSQYIHPVDDNHIIGIGKEATEQGFFQGLKMSLFDVSDVSNPKEVSKFVIGDRGTESQVLYDHKAFLYSSSKKLLVLPVMVAEIDKSKYPEDATWAYGEPKWQGAYVFTIDDSEFKVVGRISHATNGTEGYETYYGQYTVSRSLYIGDVLYTISSKLLKANSLGTLEEIKTVELPGYTLEYDYAKPMPL